MLADRVEEWAHLYEAQGFQSGFKKGREEGREVGREEGREEAEIMVLQRQLNKRFGTIPAHIETKIASASLTDIERWLDRIIDAQQLSDIFEQ